MKAEHPPRPFLEVMREFGLHITRPDSIAVLWGGFMFVYGITNRFTNVPFP